MSSEAVDSQANPARSFLSPAGRDRCPQRASAGGLPGIASRRFQRCSKILSIAIGAGVRNAPKGSGNISLLCGAIYINTRTLGLSLMYNINKTNTYIFCFTNVYFRTRKILRDSRCTTRKQTMGAQDHFLFAFPGLVLGRPGATTWWRVLLPPSLTSH